MKELKGKRERGHPIINYHTSLQGSWETRLMWAEMKLLRVEDRGRDMITCMLDFNTSLWTD